MHFLRAAIFSIAALAFMTSASASCSQDGDCGTSCVCVSSLLLLARSQTYFQSLYSKQGAARVVILLLGSWLTPENRRMKEFSLKIGVRAAGELKAFLSQSWYIYSPNSNWQSPDILPSSNCSHQSVIGCFRLVTSPVQFDMNGYCPCLSLIIG